MPLSEKQRIAIDSLATGSGVAAASEAADVHRNTVHRWMRDSAEFKLALQKEMSNVHQLKLSRVLDKVDGALQILWQIITNVETKDADRIKAIRELLQTARYVDEAG